MLNTFPLWGLSVVYRPENISATTTTTPQKPSHKALRVISQAINWAKPNTWAASSQALGGKKMRLAWGPGMVTALGAVGIDWLPLLRNDSFSKHLAFWPKKDEVSVLLAISTQIHFTFQYHSTWLQSAGSIHSSSMWSERDQRCLKKDWYGASPSPSFKSSFCCRLMPTLGSQHQHTCEQ